MAIGYMNNFQINKTEECDNKSDNTGKMSEKSGILDILLDGATYLFIASLPVSIALSQISLLVLWILFFIQCIRKKEWLGYRTSLDIALIIFVAASVLSTLFSPQFVKSIMGLKKIYLISSAYIIPFLVRDVEKARKVILVLLISTLAAAVWSIFGIKGVPHLTVSPQTMQLTVSGILMMAGALSIGYLLSLQKESVKKVSASIITIGLMLFLLRTHELSSIAALSLAFVLMAALARKKILLTMILALILCGAGFLYYKPHVLMQRFDVREQKSWSMRQRLIIWRTGWEIIKEHPVLGYGPTDLSEIYKIKRKDIGVPEHVDYRRSFGHLHNNFLQIWATMGIVGLAAFIYLIFKITAIDIITYFNIKNENKYYILGILGAQIGFIVNGLFEWNFGDSEVVTVFWVLTGLGLVYDKLGDLKKQL